MWVIGAVVGALIGAGWDHGAEWVVGAIIGGVLGLLAGKWKKALVQRVTGLEARVDALTQAIGAIRGEPGQRAQAHPTTEAVESVPPASAAPAEEIAAMAPEPAAAIRVVPAPPQPVRKGGSGIPPTEVAVAPAPVAATRAASTAGPPPAWLSWITGGNTLARVGVLILFIGVAFLIKFASERVRVPLELRLSAVALGGIALLIFGWRLRLRRHAYAMILEGGGVGVLYLTVFGALRLYSLISPTAAFVLLFAIAALSGWLAIRQDAIALAVLGIAGGFLAPVLTSTQSGSHVVLFTYYALLNAGIFGIAWFKAWRSLNLLGFVFTFIVATLWGVTRYRPEDFGTTEPFLVLFFLFYVSIAVLFALRRSVELRNYVDSALVFGTPLVAAGLQSALVRHIPYAMALSAVTASAPYLILARMLLSRRAQGLRLLIEAFLALGIIFATLAVPLALDARWTSATWALEGAAMLWVGARQRRLALRLFGLLLQVAGGVAFGLGLSFWAGEPPTRPMPILNSEYLGAVMVGLAGLFSAWQMQRRREDVDKREILAAAFVLAWGLLWWLAAGVREIDQWVPRDTRLAVLIAFLSLSAAAMAVAERTLAWPAARIPAMALLPALLLIALAWMAKPWRIDGHLFAHGGALAWPLAIAVIIALLRDADRPLTEPVARVALPLEWWHAGLLWLVTLLIAHELAWWGGRVGTGEGVWTLVPWGLVPALALEAVGVRAQKPQWPIGAHRRAYLVLGAAPLAVLLALWSLGANLHGDGDPLPLPYVPLLNPLDVTEALVMLALVSWLLRLQREESDIRGALPPQAVGAVLAILLFVWINAIALRTIHFWFGVPYAFDALWHSRMVQAVLSLLWASAALGTMLLANRRRWRVAWMAGAALLGLVVAKLFLVDLSQVGGVERIVSFIGVGLLLLLIGYFAPVPPRRPENAS